jgi:NitT/TauT family transport system permease protein
MNLIIIGLATLATVLRIFALIGLSVVSGWFLAYFAIRSRRFENTYVPIVNVLESIPVISFLPIVLIIFIYNLGQGLGVEVAADFLVFDAVAWNIWIGIYQAFKTVPENLLEVSENYRLGSFRTLRLLYIPHSIPRISSNIFSSFADAFFYISVSEIFTVGVKTYSTFGVGTIIALATEVGDFVTVYYSLFCIGIAVFVVTVLVSQFSRRAVAKYGVDTAGEIKRATFEARNRRYRRRLAVQLGVDRISKYIPRATFYQRRSNISDDIDTDLENKRRINSSGILKIVGMTIGLVLFAYLFYAAAKLVLSVPSSQWSSYFSITPFLLYAMAIDYIRVALVALAALGLAISLGYYMVTHHRAGTVLAPLVQIWAAFPAPTYFPLIFIATLPFLSTYLPFWYGEIYIFILSFVSCFYYVFFDFWIGVQAIPSEFWEVMQNHELGFLTRMRKIILPATFPYLITGISSTINSAWAGLAIGEFWPLIDGKHSLYAGVGMMKFITENMASGQVGDAAWVSFIFAIVVAIYGIVFTRNLMDLARKKYVVEEGIYAA